MALRTVTCCLLLVLAGCAGLPASGGPAERSATPSPTPGGTPTPTPEGEDFSYAQLTAGFEVQAFQAPPVRVVAVGHRSGRTVVNGTYDGTFAVEFGDEDGPFVRNTTYDVTLRVNGEVAWNRTIRNYEGYQLRVGENGTVTETGHWVA
jgi:hypothetical protein